MLSQTRTLDNVNWIPFCVWHCHNDNPIKYFGVIFYLSYIHFINTNMAYVNLFWIFNIHRLDLKKQNKDNKTLYSIKDYQKITVLCPPLCMKNVPLSSDLIFFNTHWYYSCTDTKLIDDLLNNNLNKYKEMVNQMQNK